MVVAGVGCRHGATVDSVLAAITAACLAAAVAPTAIQALATAEAKAAEPGILAAAAQLAVPLTAITANALQAAGARCLSHSQRVVDLFQVPSLAEAAALAAAGPSARLLGPRQAAGEATCALAAEPAGEAP